MVSHFTDASSQKSRVGRGNFGGIKNIYPKTLRRYDKWLKDRRGRQLSYKDLTHYQKIVVALKQTIRIIAEIDAAIGKLPLV